MIEGAFGMKNRSCGCKCDSDNDDGDDCDKYTVIVKVILIYSRETWTQRDYMP